MRRTVVAAALTLALLAACAHKKYVQLGDLHARSGEWHLALQNYAQAAAIKPDDPKINAKLEDAREHAIRVSINRGDDALAAGELAAARHAVDEGLEIAPRNPDLKRLDEKIDARSVENARAALRGGDFAGAYGWVVSVRHPGTLVAIREEIREAVRVEAEDLAADGKFRLGVELLDVISEHEPELDTDVRGWKQLIRLAWADDERRASLAAASRGRRGDAFVHQAFAAVLSGRDRDAMDRETRRQDLLAREGVSLGLGVGADPASLDLRGRVASAVADRPIAVEWRSRGTIAGSVVLGRDTCTSERTGVRQAIHRYVSHMRRVDNPDWLRWDRELHGFEADAARGRTELAAHQRDLRQAGVVLSLMLASNVPLESKATNVHEIFDQARGERERAVEAVKAAEDAQRAVETYAADHDRLKREAAEAGLALATAVENRDAATAAHEEVVARWVSIAQKCDGPPEVLKPPICEPTRAELARAREGLEVAAADHAEAQAAMGEVKRALEALEAPNAAVRELARSLPMRRVRLQRAVDAERDAKARVVEVDRRLAAARVEAERATRVRDEAQGRVDRSQAQIAEAIRAAQHAEARRRGVPQYVEEPVWAEYRYDIETWRRSCTATGTVSFTSPVRERMAVTGGAADTDQRHAGFAPGGLAADRLSFGTDDASLIRSARKKRDSQVVGAVEGQVHAYAGSLLDRVRRSTDRDEITTAYLVAWWLGGPPPAGLGEHLRESYDVRNVDVVAYRQ